MHTFLYVSVYECGTTFMTSMYNHALVGLGIYKYTNVDKYLSFVCTYNEVLYIW